MTSLEVKLPPSSRRLPWPAALAAELAHPALRAETAGQEARDAEVRIELLPVKGIPLAERRGGRYLLVGAMISSFGK